MDGLVLVPTRGDECAVIDLTTGEVTTSLALRNPNGAVAQPVFVADIVAIPMIDGRIYFHDLARRRLVGVYEAPGELRYDPLVIDGALIIATDSGYVIAVDATSQRERWRYPGPGRPGLVQPATGAPVLMNGELWHVTADGLVTVLDAGTGRNVREVRLALHSRTTSVRHQVAVTRDALFAVTSDAHVIRANPSTGAAIWSTQLGARASSAPILTADHVIVIDEDGVISLIRARDGRVVARHELGVQPVAAPVLDGDLLIVAVRGGRLFALEVSGEEFTRTWEYAARTPDGDPVRITTRPVVRDAVVLFGADDGRLRAVLR